MPSSAADVSARGWKSHGLSMRLVVASHHARADDAVDPRRESHGARVEMKLGAMLDLPLPDIERLLVTISH
jgi:hypothetical protein